MIAPNQAPLSQQPPRGVTLGGIFYPAINRNDIVNQAATDPANWRRGNTVAGYSAGGDNGANWEWADDDQGKEWQRQIAVGGGDSGTWSEWAGGTPYGIRGRALTGMHGSFTGDEVANLPMANYMTSFDPDGNLTKFRVKSGEKEAIDVPYKLVGDYYVPDASGAQRAYWDTNDGAQNMALLSLALAPIGAGAFGATAATAAQVAQGAYGAYQGLESGNALQAIGGLAGAVGGLGGMGAFGQASQAIGDAARTVGGAAQLGSAIQRRDPLGMLMAGSSLAGQTGLIDRGTASSIRQAGSVARPILNAAGLGPRPQARPPQVRPPQARPPQARPPLSPRPQTGVSRPPQARPMGQNQAMMPMPQRRPSPMQQMAMMAAQRRRYNGA